MVNVRNIQRKNALSHILLGKPLGYLSSLLLIHNNDGIGPGNLLFGNRPFIVKPGRFSLKFASKQIFSCFAPVLVLVAHEQYFHKPINIIEQYKFFAS